MDGRRGAAVVAIAAYAGCLGIVGSLSALDGRVRSILVIPLALACMWGFVVLIGSVFRVILGESPEEPTRTGMLLVAVCAAMVALGLLALASWIDSNAVSFGLEFLASAGFWVCLGAVMGAIFGELPEIGMAEGD